MADMLKEAVRLRKLGFAIHWLVPGEKRPISDGWAEAPVMPVEELKKSYRVGYNVGFRPGKWSIVNGREICVLDVVRMSRQAESSAALPRWHSSTMTRSKKSGLNCL